MSALIWLAIVAVWGFVLIPMWLRHHDSTLEQRSAERFTTAMRVLSRRGSARSDRRFAVSSTDAGAGGVQAGPVQKVRTQGPPMPATASAATFAPQRRLPRDAERAAILRVRRQRVMALGACVVVFALLALILGGAWIIVQLLLDAGLVAYLAYLRRVTIAERRLRASRAARDRRLAESRVAWTAPADTGRGRTERAPAGGVLFAPVASRGSATAGTVAPHRADEVASVETVDLSAVIEAAARRAGEIGGRILDADAVESSIEYPSAGESTVAYEIGDRPTPDASGDELSDDEQDSYDERYGTPLEAGPSARRPGARPTTSKPGRVQVNPPGTHGGIVDAPSQAPAASTPADGQAVAGKGEDRDDLDELLERHAVGS